jgi:tRNA modification GTPase
MPKQTTIAAISTPPGRGAVAVLRVSGPAAATALLALTGSVPVPRRATLATLRDPDTREVIDSALVLFFAGPASFTGEDMAELHVHGGRAIVRRVMNLLTELPGVRAALAGDFTRRALEHGKLDLTQVEALSDLIDSDTELQRQFAVKSFRGEFGEVVGAWRQEVVTLLAFVEAQIDFTDEADIPDSLRNELERRLSVISADMSNRLARTASREQLVEGFKVVLAGAPNAGKSSLLNALAGRDVAIVSAHPGTTRDVLELRLEIEGAPVVVRDVAGLREAQDMVEQMGIARAERAMREADLVLWLIAVDSDSKYSAVPPCDAKSWVIRTKADLAHSCKGVADILISAKTGAGIGDLLARLGRAAHATLGDHDNMVMVSARQRGCLSRSVLALTRAKVPDLPIEFVAEELRGAARALGEIVGVIGTEEVLGEIFGRFCIGK